MRVCCFCGKKIETKENEDVKIDDIMMISQDEDYAICGQCLKEGYSTLLEAMKEEEIEIDEDLTPKNLKDRLDQWIIGQDLAKKRLAIAIYDHYKRIHQPVNIDDDVVIEKSNIILIGSTGSGKTALLKALSKELDLPLLIEDVTTITTTGYQGRNIEDVLSGLLSETNGDVDLAQQGIVLLDEGDKLRKQPDAAGNRDVKGEGVQQGLLKIVEGGVFDVKYKGMPIKFDTSNVLFILAGAFEGIEKIIAKRQKEKANIKTNGGFLAPIASAKDEKGFNDYILDVKHIDLKNYGMMPELLGRFPVITPLQELSVEALVEILTEPKNAIVSQIKKSFGFDNVEIEFTKGALQAIAKKAKERQIGARALRSIIEEIIEDAKFECPGSDIKKVIINDYLQLKYIKNEEEKEI